MKFHKKKRPATKVAGQGIMIEGKSADSKIKGNQKTFKLVNQQIFPVLFSRWN